MTSVLLTIVSLVVLGIPVALFFDRRARGGLLLGLAFLHGTGLVYLVMLLLSAAGISWSLPRILAPALLAAAAAGFFARRRAAANEPAQPGDAISGVLDTITIVLVAAYALYATAAAVWEWDFWAIWGLKGRVFYELGGIDWRFLESAWNEFAHRDYPPLLPFDLALFGMTNGGWDDRWLGMLFVAFGGATVLIVRSMAGRELPPRFAAAIALAVTPFALSRYVGLAEAPLIAYAIAGLLLVRRAIEEDDDAGVRHGALMLGLAASCKNEGLALIVAAAVALLVTNRRRIVHLWPAIAIALPWKILAATHGIYVDLGAGDVPARALGRAAGADAVFAALLSNLGDRWMWLAFLGALLIVPAVERRRERFLFVAVGVQLLLGIGAYFVTPHDVLWHVANSWQRVVRQVGAPMAFASLTMLGRFVRSG